MEVTETLCSQVEKQEFDLYVCNLANLDMVGHTGNIQAAILACETVDQCVGRIVQAALDQDGIVLLTSDHGNADDMLDQDGSPKTAHSCNPVPFSLISVSELWDLREAGILADIAPTILELWSLAQPSEMGGKSLLAKKE